MVLEKCAEGRARKKDQGRKRKRTTNTRKKDKGEEVLRTGRKRKRREEESDDTSPNEGGKDQEARKQKRLIKGSAWTKDVKKVLEKAGMTIDDIDLFEINEAFAVVAAKFVRDLDLDWDKVNVNGGSIALGHPIGATGSILIGTIVDELERRDLKTGLVTMCAAGGMAPAIIVERVDDFVD